MKFMTLWLRTYQWVYLFRSGSNLCWYHRPLWTDWAGCIHNVNKFQVSSQLSVYNVWLALHGYMEQRNIVHSEDAKFFTILIFFLINFGTAEQAQGFFRQVTATEVDLGSTVQVSTHFLSKAARKTVAARHVSGNSHGQTGFAARLFPPWHQRQKPKQGFSN